MSRWHRTEFDFLPEQAFRRRPGGGMTLEGGGGGGGNDQAQMVATMMQANASQQQLDWAREVYASEAPQRQATTLLSNQVSQAQVDLMRQQQQSAAVAAQDYESLYRPLERQIVTDATNYDTPERREAATREAVSTVEQNLAAQRGATMREMERAGVNPASAKTMALQSSLDLNAAKAKAGAGNAAAKQVETVGYARRMDAAGLGRGVVGSQGTSASLASQIGTGAVGSSGAALAAGQSGTGLVQNAYNTAVQGYGSAASQFGNMAANATSATNQSSANTAAGLGAVVTVGVAI